MSRHSKSEQFMEEYELVQACKKGLAAAQNVLYRQYAKSLLILCIRYIGNKEEAKELLMDSFVQSFRNFSQFQYLGEGSLQAWLKRIAISQCLMHLRKKNIVYLELKDEYDELPIVNNDIIDQMSVGEIMQLIHNLPSGYRSVFNLYVFEQLSHKEIAVMLEISESTSKTQLHKARQLLQKQFLQAQKKI